MLVGETRLDRLKRITKQNKFRLFACALSGIVSSIPYFYPSFFFLSWFSYVTTFYFIINCSNSGKQACLYLFLTELTRNAMTLAWFRELLGMTVFDMPKIFLVLIIALAIFGISFFQSAVLCISAYPIRAIFTHCKSGAVSAVCSAIFYTVCEYLLGIGPLGFPWSAIYISQQKFLVAIQSASLFGAHFVSFVVILTNICIAIIIKRRREGNKIKGLGIFLLIALLSNILFGVYELYSTTDSRREIKVSTIQDNTSSYDKWNGTTREILEKVKSELKSARSADLVLCSETVFPITLDTDVVHASSLAKEVELYLCDWTHRNKNVVVAGGFAEKGNKNYNSLFLFDNGNIYPDTYDKKDIVPFGEFLPMEDFLVKVFPFIDNLNLSSNSLTAGKQALVFTTSAGKLGGMICFDSIFYDNARDSVKNGAHILLLSTNDSWYNDSSATVQHLGHAVFRAVENKRYLVRSATTGYSAIIDEDGRIINKSELLTQACISAKAELKDCTTLFNRYGYIPSFIAALSALLFLIICVFDSVKAKKPPTPTDKAV